MDAPFVSVLRWPRLLVFRRRFHPRAGQGDRARPRADQGRVYSGQTLHTVHGLFSLTGGTLCFDPPTGKARANSSWTRASGDSGSKARDKRMHSNILESEKYPLITFRPDRVEGKVATEGKSEVQVHGMFSIHGAEHEITVPARVEASGGVYRVNATFQAPYVKWGMKNPSTLLLRVNDTVAITVHTVVHTM